jgi:hypothetical protein
LPGKEAVWKRHVAELAGPRKAEYEESRRRAGVTTERVWLQHTPQGDFAIVYLEAADIGKVFETFLTSQEPFDQWFREQILVDVHGMDPAGPPPPVNEPILT